MGMFDFFRHRRERENAIPESEALGSFARSEDQPVIGQQVGGGGQVQLGSTEIQGVAGLAEGLEALGVFGPMIQKAIAEGNVTIEQGPTQTIDLRGSGLREEIFQIMQQHGIDPEAGSGESVDAGAHGEMQQQILDALSKHGVDPTGGTAPRDDA